MHMYFCIDLMFDIYIWFTSEEGGGCSSFNFLWGHLEVVLSIWLHLALLLICLKYVLVCTSEEVCTSDYKKKKKGIYMGEDDIYSPWLIFPFSVSWACPFSVSWAIWLIIFTSIWWNSSHLYKAWENVFVGQTKIEMRINLEVTDDMSVRPIFSSAVICRLHTPFSVAVGRDSMSKYCYLLQVSLSVCTSFFSPGDVKSFWSTC